MGGLSVHLRDRHTSSNKATPPPTVPFPTDCEVKVMGQGGHSYSNTTESKTENGTAGRENVFCPKLHSRDLDELVKAAVPDSAYLIILGLLFHRGEKTKEVGCGKLQASRSAPTSWLTLF